MIDSVRDAHLLLAAHHNLAASYIEIGRPEEALAIADSIRDLYRAHAEPGVRLKALWQQGALLLEVGHLESAEKLLSGAREGYLELGLAHEAAEISLRLAEVYRRNGETQKLRRTLEETVPIFRSLRFGPELLAAMIRLQEAAAAAEEGTTA
jgi:tetratricopeptide (TPR) repeat protein